MRARIYFIFIITILFSCNSGKDVNDGNTGADENDFYFEGMYVPFSLKTDLSMLTANQKEIIPLLIEAADMMDRLFWQEAYGKKDSLFNLPLNEDLLEFSRINYGPWDRLNDNKPFIEGIGEKPKGANFYPVDMSKEEFESADVPGKRGLYSMIRRDREGNLISVPYHEFFRSEVEKVAGLLEKAAGLAEDEGFKKYLRLRAEALRTDDYLQSDLAWMEMTENTLDVVIGPIETYEDKLFGYKAAHEAYILIKDKEWSRKLDRYAEFLPELQQNLPVPDEYKKDLPGSEGQLNAYDVIYYAGDCNAGSKTIAINLPNDEEVQLTKGTRRLQLKNAMQAKFDKILIPIAGVLIDQASISHITFDAFFANTMFHEVAHGLGIKNTLNGKGTVRSALKEHSAALEEGKADILGLYMITELNRKGEIKTDLEDYYITFLAGIFRSIRFGAETAHGKANMIRFNFFSEMDAFVRDPDTGRYTVNFEQMQKAVRELSNRILVFQGDGDYEGVTKFVEKYAIIGPELRADLDRLEEKNIPVDIIFNQGLDVLGL